MEGVDKARIVVRLYFAAACVASIVALFWARQYAEGLGVPLLEYFARLLAGSGVPNYLAVPWIDCAAALAGSSLGCLFLRARCPRAAALSLGAAALVVLVAYCFFSGDALAGIASLPFSVAFILNLASAVICWRSGVVRGSGTPKEDASI